MIFMAIKYPGRCHLFYIYSDVSLLTPVQILLHCTITPHMISELNILDEVIVQCAHSFENTLKQATLLMHGMHLPGTSSIAFWLHIS